MPNDRPYGANSLVIPFTLRRVAPKGAGSGGMSRVGAADESFRNGVAGVGAAPGRSEGAAATSGKAGDLPEG